MKLMDLYTRVVETTGLDVITLDSLNTAVANCMADLTSRGYRTFAEKHLEDLSYRQNKNLITFQQPSDVRKNLYIRLFLNNEAIVATRYSLSNKRVACKYEEGAFRSLLVQGQAIYYVKGDTIVIEWDPRLGDVQDICYGYYQRLIAPKVDSTIEDVEQLETIEFDIREEFEDALYKVIDIVNDSESNNDEEYKKIVIYQALYGDKLKWARAYDMFNSEVDHEKYPTVEQKYRFEEID